MALQSWLGPFWGFPGVRAVLDGFGRVFGGFGGFGKVLEVSGSAASAVCMETHGPQNSSKHITKPTKTIPKPSPNPPKTPRGVVLGWFWETFWGKNKKPDVFLYLFIILYSFLQLFISFYIFFNVGMFFKVGLFFNVFIAFYSHRFLTLFIIFNVFHSFLQPSFLTEFPFLYPTARAVLDSFFF